MALELGARTGSSTTLVSRIMSSVCVVTKHPVGWASWNVSWPVSDSNVDPKRVSWKGIS